MEEAQLDLVEERIELERGTTGLYFLSFLKFAVFGLCIKRMCKAFRNV